MFTCILFDKELIKLNFFCYMYLFPLMVANMDLHYFIISDDFDGCFRVSSSFVPRSNHITEHTLSCVAIHRVSLVQHLPNPHP